MIFGFVVIAINMVLALIGPLIAPFPPHPPAPRLIPTKATHWFGPDVSGMDIFSRVLAAPRVDLTIALVSTTVAFACGVALGVLSGFFAGSAANARCFSG